MPPRKKKRPQFTRSNTCQAHCVRCNMCFATDAAFDAHLGGPLRRFRHRDPERVKDLRLRTDEGQCRVVSPLERYDREIWEHGPITDAAREAFARVEAKRRKRR